MHNISCVSVFYGFGNQGYLGYGVIDSRLVKIANQLDLNIAESIWDNASN